MWYIFAQTSPEDQFGPQTSRSSPRQSLFALWPRGGGGSCFALSDERPGIKPRYNMKPAPTQLQQVRCAVGGGVPCMFASLKEGLLRKQCNWCTCLGSCLAVWLCFCTPQPLTAMGSLYFNLYLITILLSLLPPGTKGVKGWGLVTENVK